MHYLLLHFIHSCVQVCAGKRSCNRPLEMEARLPPPAHARAHLNVTTHIEVACTFLNTMCRHVAAGLGKVIAAFWESNQEGFAGSVPGKCWRLRSGETDRKYFLGWAPLKKDHRVTRTLFSNHKWPGWGTRFRGSMARGANAASGPDTVEKALWPSKLLARGWIKQFAHGLLDYPRMKLLSQILASAIARLTQLGILLVDAVSLDLHTLVIIQHNRDQ